VLAGAEGELPHSSDGVATPTVRRVGADKVPSLTVFPVPLVDRLATKQTAPRRPGSLSTEPKNTFEGH